MPAKYRGNKGMEGQLICKDSPGQDKRSAEPHATALDPGNVVFISSSNLEDSSCSVHLNLIYLEWVPLVLSK